MAPVTIANERKKGNCNRPGRRQKIKTARTKEKEGKGEEWMRVLNLLTIAQMVNGANTEVTIPTRPVTFLACMAC